MHLRQITKHGRESIHSNAFPSPTSVSADKTPEEKLGSSVFERTKNDDKCAPSFESKAFLKTMGEGFVIVGCGLGSAARESWEWLMGAVPKLS